MSILKFIHPISHISHYRRTYRPGCHSLCKYIFWTDNQTIHCGLRSYYSISQTNWFYWINNKFETKIEWFYSWLLFYVPKKSLSYRFQQRSYTIQPLYLYYLVRTTLMHASFQPVVFYRDIFCSKQRRR